MFVIFGATGKVGGAAIRSLRDQGHPVRAVLRDRAKAPPLAALGCEIATADLSDPGATAEAMAGATAVQMLVPMLPHAADARAEMEGLVDRLAEALERARPPRSVVISDYGAQVPEDTGITLVFRHLETRLRGFPGMIFLRSAEHMENWSRMVRFAAGTGILPSMHHPLSKRFPMVSAGDVGRAAAALLIETAPPGVVHVEGPRRHTSEEVARALAPALGRSVTAVAAPRADWHAALVGAGLGASYAGLVTALYDAHNAGKIEVEPGGDVRHGTAELADILARLAG